jgi:hypothetical protein
MSKPEINVAHQKECVMHEPAHINPGRLAAAENRPQPLLLNEGQAASFFGVGRRKFHDVRQQPWFTEKCTALVLGERALRFHRDELMAAAANAPRVVKKAEPKTLADARLQKAAA